MLFNRNFADLITFARASAGWSYSAGGVLVQAVANAPRLDYDPITLAVRGMLVEDLRTNLLWPSMYSSTVAPAYYDITNANSIISGGTAKRFVAKGTGGAPASSIGGNGFTDATQKVAWAIVESDPLSAAGAVTQLVLYRTVPSSGFATFVNFNLTSFTASGSGSYGAFKISDVGPNGGKVYAIWTAYTAVAGETIMVYPYPIVTNGAGQTGQSLFVHHVQAELGAYPSSPIVTTAAQATRAADNATITDLSKIGFSQGEGTAYAEFVVPRLAAGVVGDTMQGVLTITDAALNNYFSVGVGATGACSLYRKGAASPAALNGANSLVPGSVAKVAFCYGSAQNDAICLNGGTVASGSAGNPSGMTEMRLGRFAGNPGWLNGWLRNVRYFPRRFSNSELQSLTA